MPYTIVKAQMMRSQEFHSTFPFHVHSSEIMAELSFDIDSYVLPRTQLRQKNKKGLLNRLGLTEHVVRERKMVENRSKYINMKNVKNS